MVGIHWKSIIKYLLPYGLVVWYRQRKDNIALPPIPVQNHRLAEEEWQNRQIVVRSTPPIMSIETTTFCNLHCVMCRVHGLLDGKVSGQNFAKKNIRKLAAFVSRADSFQLHGFGEPLCGPAFWDMLNFIAKHNKGPASITINTNGHLLDVNITEKLLHSRLTDVNFSLDAACAETYRKIRDADFDKVLHNIAELIRLRNARGRTDPKVVINMTLMQENIAELVRFIELGSDLGVDRIEFWPINERRDAEAQSWKIERNGWTFNYLEQCLSVNPELAGFFIKSALERAEALGVPIALNEEFKTVMVKNHTAQSAEYNSGGPSVLKNETCGAPWRWLLVRANGDINVCCFMKEPLGNINEVDLVKFWNGRLMQELRQSLSRGILPPACQGASCRFTEQERKIGNGGR